MTLSEILVPWLTRHGVDLEAKMAHLGRRYENGEIPPGALVQMLHENIHGSHLNALWSELAEELLEPKKKKVARSA